MKPANIERTENYREAEAKSALLKSLNTHVGPEEKKKVVIIGGGLSGLSCAKYLVDAGYAPTHLCRVYIESERHRSR